MTKLTKPTIQNPTTPTFNHFKNQVTNDPEINECTADIWQDVDPFRPMIPILTYITQLYLVIFRINVQPSPRIRLQVQQPVSVRMFFFTNSRL
jgi:hypothetical protein